MPRGGEESHMPAQSTFVVTAFPFFFHGMYAESIYWLLCFQHELHQVSNHDYVDMTA
jgi:hypothetical protein